MQILVLKNYNWGHLLPMVEKTKLADALENAHANLQPNTDTSGEVVVVQTAEDFLE
jgi:hypothetical protein